MILVIQAHFFKSVTKIQILFEAGVFISFIFTYVLNLIW